MLRKALLCAVAAGFLWPAVSVAQDDEESFVYATYFYCDVASEAMADAVVDAVMAPAYNKAVADGHIDAWGWMSHHTGGQWRRILWRSADSLMGVMNSFDVVQENMGEGSQALGDAFSAACGAHDDYVWTVEGGSSGEDVDENRAGVGLSVYFVCDEAKESRADEIVAETIGPLYEAQVANGTLNSWGWMSHHIGGKYRRLATMTATDLPALFKARNAILESMMDDGEASGAGEEFTSICGSHSDYVWNLENEG